MSLNLHRAEVVGFLGDVPKRLARVHPLYSSDEGYFIGNDDGTTRAVVSSEFKKRCSRIQSWQSANGHAMGMVAMSSYVAAVLTRVVPSFVWRDGKTVSPVTNQDGLVVILPFKDLDEYLSSIGRELRGEVDGLLTADGSPREAVKLATIGLGCYRPTDGNHRTQMFVRRLAAKFLLLNPVDENDQRCFTRQILATGAILGEAESRLRDLIAGYLREVKRESRRPSLVVDEP